MASAFGIITHRFAYDGGRKVTVLLPRETPVGIVYAGDGAGIRGWEDGLHAEGVPAIVVVSVHATDSADEMDRLREYSPNFAPERFAAHEEFFVTTVRTWVERQIGRSFSREQTAMLGVSAGGELSLALGLRHPDVYGNVI